MLVVRESELPVSRTIQLLFCFMLFLHPIFTKIWKIKNINRFPDYSFYEIKSFDSILGIALKINVRS